MTLEAEKTWEAEIGTELTQCRRVPERVPRPAGCITWISPPSSVVHGTHHVLREGLCLSITPFLPQLHPALTRDIPIQSRRVGWCLPCRARGSFLPLLRAAGCVEQILFSLSCGGTHRASRHPRRPGTEQGQRLPVKPAPFMLKQPPSLHLRLGQHFPFFTNSTKGSVAGYFWQSTFQGLTGTLSYPCPYQEQFSAYSPVGNTGTTHSSVGRETSTAALEDQQSWQKPFSACQ